MNKLDKDFQRFSSHHIKVNKSAKLIIDLGLEIHNGEDRIGLRSNPEPNSEQKTSKHIHLLDCVV
jgi:hypothetical protein